LPAGFDVSSGPLRKLCVSIWKRCRTGRGETRLRRDSVPLLIKIEKINKKSIKIIIFIKNPKNANTKREGGSLLVKFGKGDQRKSFVTEVIDARSSVVWASDPASVRPATALARLSGAHSLS